MKFIEMSGQSLLKLVKSDEFDSKTLRKIGVGPKSIVRVNLHGDIELRQRQGWDVIGGLFGDFESRVRKETGLDWA